MTPFAIPFAIPSARPFAIPSRSIAIPRLHISFNPPSSSCVIGIPKSFSRTCRFSATSMSLDSSTSSNFKISQSVSSGLPRQNTLRDWRFCFQDSAPPLRIHYSMAQQKFPLWQSSKWVSIAGPRRLQRGIHFANIAAGIRISDTAPGGPPGRRRSTRRPPHSGP